MCIIKIKDSTYQGSRRDKTKTSVLDFIESNTLRLHLKGHSLVPAIECILIAQPSLCSLENNIFNCLSIDIDGIYYHRTLNKSRTDEMNGFRLELEEVYYGKYH